MGDIQLDLSGLPAARKRRERAGLALVRDSAGEGRRVARREAPVDTSELKNSIARSLTPSGADVVVGAEHGIWLEYGTGIYAEGGGGRKTPWVYLHPRFGWVTTRGGRPQPYMRPGFAASTRFFETEKRRRGLYQ